MKKNYILDTNVLIRDPNCIYKFEDNNVIIPLVCIEELDKLKQKDDLTGYNAKQVGRELYKLTKETDLSKTGFKLPTGGLIRIETNHLNGVLPDGFDDKKADNKLLIITKNIANEDKKIKTILVTQDIYLTIKATSLGLNVQDYENDKIKIEEIYKGKKNIVLSTDTINKIYDLGVISPAEIDLDSSELFPNMFLIVENLENPSHPALFKYDGKNIKPLKFQNEQAFGISAKNLEQKMAFELLMDDSLPLVTISGSAGTGKTILSFATAMEKVVEKRLYNKIILVRPVVPAGDDIGFLPGTETEKLRPWMGSFYDALESMLNIKNKKKSKENLTGNAEKPTTSKAEDLISLMQEKGLIETKTFTYMRGRNLSNALVIIDESQEMTPHLAKLMLTRAGEDARFIMIGDPSDNQIDNTLVNSKTNGFVYVIENMKKSKLTGHVAFEKVERSPLAKEAESLL